MNIIQIRGTDTGTGQIKKNMLKCAPTMMFSSSKPELNLTIRATRNGMIGHPEDTGSLFLLYRGCGIR